MYYPKAISKHLHSILSKMAADTSSFVQRPGKDFTRKRKLDFERIIQLIITMDKSSLNRELLRSFKFSCNAPSASAFCQQRSKIRPEAFEFLFYQFHKVLDKPKTYKGYRLLAVDGLKLTIATNPYEPDNYIVNRNAKYSQLHLTVLFDLCSKRYDDTFIQPGNHYSEARGIVSAMERIPSDPKAIYIADRGYESYNVFAHMERKHTNYLIRVKDLKGKGMVSGLKMNAKGSFDVDTNVIITSKKTAAQTKHTDIYKFPNKRDFDFLDATQKEYPLSFRVVRFPISETNYECIITNLPRNIFPLAEIKKLYAKRWGIETAFRQLKHITGLFRLHSKKVAYIKQEIFARLLLYNYCATITAHVIPVCNSTKYIYQHNYTVAAEICRRFLIGEKDIRPPDVELLIKKYRLPIKPDRKFPRTKWGVKANSFNYR